MKLIKYLLLTGLIIGIVVILTEALLPANISKIQSDAVTSVVKPIEHAEKLNMPLNLYVRKAIGHFGAFFLLGICAIGYFLFCFKRVESSFLICLLIGLFVSVGSELLQMIPEGRVCTISDMVLDFFGFFISSSIIFIVAFTIFIGKKISKAY